ncbi:MAG TPA: NupC/NupG family nucleoside CNT transporter [Elusimicrobiota bacterium]|nr:NupC/NupG family nucleoside CNT transporter [Elusimicrobiota bacterium]
MSGKYRRILSLWLLFLAFGILGAAGASIGAWALSSSSDTVAVSTPAPTAPSTAEGRIRQIQSAEADLSWTARVVSLGGLFVLLGLCWLMSNNRRKINWSLVAWGTALQLLFAILVLKTSPGLWVFERLNDLVNALLGFTQEGTEFLFRSMSSGRMESPMLNFAFTVLPTIIFFSSLMTVLYHVGIMPWIVKAFAVAMRKTMKTSGAETLSTSANIFVGQTEAPLVVKPYIEKMTMSELMAVMVGGFANTAGGVLAAYVGLLRDSFPDIAGHLIAQSVMSAPAALVCAKIVFPETERPETHGEFHMTMEKVDSNAIDAAARGAAEGLKLALNVAAMLLAFIALIAMLNGGLKLAGTWFGCGAVSLERIFGFAFWPLAWVMGVPTPDCTLVAQWLGTKTVLNEFVAYLDMAQYLNGGSPIHYRSVVIASYALSGFANFSSIAIQIGGISGIAPSRRHDLAKIGLKAMFVGAIATFTTATIAGLLI